jgi:cytochrome c-type biogenesis protein CcmF
VRWQREQPRPVLAMLLPWLALALVAGVLTFLVAPQGRWKAAAGVTAAAWVAGGTLRFAWQRWRKQGRFTPEMAGMLLAHLGIAVFLIGALLVQALSVQREVALAPGQSVALGRYVFRFDALSESEGPNYLSERADLSVLRDGRTVARLHPEKRRYLGNGQVMTETGIRPSLRDDLYVALGEPLGNGAWAVRVHVKPFVRWIWLGGLLMAMGGFVTAADRRFRKMPDVRKEDSR